MVILAVPFAYFQKRQGGVGARIFDRHHAWNRLLHAEPVVRRPGPAIRLAGGCRGSHSDGHLPRARDRHDVYDRSGVSAAGPRLRGAFKAGPQSVHASACEPIVQKHVIAITKAQRKPAPSRASPATAATYRRSARPIVNAVPRRVTSRKRHVFIARVCPPRAQCHMK